MLTIHYTIVRTLTTHEGFQETRIDEYEYSAWDMTGVMTTLNEFGNEFGELDVIGPVFGAISMNPVQGIVDMHYETENPGYYNGAWHYGLALRMLDRIDAQSVELLAITNVITGFVVDDETGNKVDLEHLIA